MTPASEPPTSVGQQLVHRREELDLTQDALAQRIGITTTTISAIERDRNEIQRSKRPAWERALRLRPGTISQAYKDGTLIEAADAAPDQPYADMSDPDEAAAWRMNLPEDVRRNLVDAIRAGRAHHRQA